MSYLLCGLPWIAFFQSYHCRDRTRRKQSYTSARQSPKVGPVVQHYRFIQMFKLPTSYLCPSLRSSPTLDSGPGVRGALHCQSEVCPPSGDGCRRLPLPCPNVFTPCTNNGCNAMYVELVRRHQLARHLERRCALRAVKCKYCSEVSRKVIAWCP